VHRTKYDNRVGQRGGGAHNPSMYGDKGGIPVELQLLVIFIQLLYSTLSPTEGSCETSKTDVQVTSK